MTRRRQPEIFMGGRFAQYRTAINCLEALGANLADFWTGLETRPLGRYNVAPGSRALLLKRQDAGLQLDPLICGYLPWWAPTAGTNGRSIRTIRSASCPTSCN